MLTKKGEIMRINIIYFTSTGNTLWLATRAKEIMEQQGHEVKLYEVIKDGDDFIKDECDMLGIFYPVWCYMFPNPLRNFVQTKMPNGKGKKAFLIGNYAGSIADTSMHCKRLMDSKGYNSFYLNDIIMPINVDLPWLPFTYFIKVPDEVKLNKILAKAEKKVTKYLLIRTEV